MAEQDNIKVILKKDPTFEGLDFSLLRRLGLEHIGELSGKVWTDHNVHDPGITILEMLIYALMDLGYRTRLPIEDLLALEDPSQAAEDNFFTPAQILTNNPTTILDYRKLLIDIEGVRNAWLEVHREDKLCLDCPGETPNGEGDHGPVFIAGQGGPRQNSPSLFFCPEGEHDFSEVVLNGLYKAFIELDEDFIAREIERNKNRKENEQKNRSDVEAEVVNRVKQQLQQHRNLCEDFVDICVLCREKVSFCVDVELFPSAVAEQVYVEIIQNIREFLSPSLHFYTLQEMLARGKSIEEVFEGRPYTLDSHGFIDTEELERIERHKELHLSDIYNLIFSVSGVKSVRALKLSSGQQPNTACDGWVYHLCEDCVPFFSVEDSQFNLFKGTMPVRLDKVETQKLLNRRLNEFRKVKLKDARLLDRLIPLGRYRKDLEDYYSIQNEFPRVYGIGEGGLPDSAPVLRQAQALQLKGYLLFFDQLLASYLSQLAHIRDLFSMSPDSRRPEASRHTYFTQRLDSVPDVKRLVRFYTEEQSYLGWSENNILAQPVEKGSLDELMAEWREAPETEPEYPAHFFDAPFKREASLQQLRQEFQQAEYQLEVFGGKCAYFFTILTSNQEVGLVSKRLYDTKAQAWEAGRSVAFLGALEDSYQEVNEPNPAGTAYRYSFNLSFNPISYLSFLQQIMEDEKLYQSRRDDFLNHLLARFGEAFTDLSLLMYEKIVPEHNGKARLLEDKARYLSDFDELSRNRGKAYNYCLNSWDTDNVSGLEKRVAGLAGIQDVRRQYLCNFEIVEYGEELEAVLRSLENEALFKTTERFDSRAYAETAVASMMDSLRAGEGMKVEHVVAEDKFRLYLRTDKAEAASPGLFGSREEAENKVEVLKALFNPKAFGGGVYVSEYKSHLELRNAGGEILRKSRKQFEAGRAIEDKDYSDFVRNVNNQLKAREEVASVNLAASLEEPKVYFDRQGLSGHQEIGAPKYKWVWLDDSGNTVLQSTPSFTDTSAALAHFSSLLGPLELRFEDKDEGKEPAFLVQWPSGETAAEGVFDNKAARDEARQKAAAYLEKETGEGVYLSAVRKSYGWELKKGKTALLESTLLGSSSNKAKMAWQYAHALSAKLEVVERKDTGFLVELRNQDGILMAHSPVFSDEKQAEQNRKMSASLLSSEKNISFPERGEAYGYRIPGFGDDPSPFLSSYFLFESRRDALQAMEAHLKHAGKVSRYNLSGDLERFSLSFELKDKDGQLIAEHSGMYGDEKERKAILDRGAKQLRKFNFPLQYREKYRYKLIGQEGSALLESAREYDSEEEANQAFLQILPLAAYPANYHGDRPDDNINQFLELRDGDAVLARAPRPFPTGQGLAQAREQAISLVKAHSYSVSSSEYPHRWKYRLSWEGKEQKLESLLDSIGDFGTDDEAVTAFNRLADNLETVAAIPADGPSIRFQYKGEAEPFAAYPGQPFETEAERESVRQRADRWLQYSGHVSRAGASLPASAGPTLYRPAESADGRFAYRVLKKGLPLAFHPCKCYSRKDRQAIQEAINCLYGERNHYDYPEFCLDGDAICKIEERYHYQLRDKKKGIPAYFISFEGYASREEALAALRSNYLEIVHLAIDERSYRDRAIRNSVYPPLISLVQEYADPEERRPAGLSPLVVVPKEAIDEFGITQDNPQAYVELFFRYPIQLAEPSCPKDPCKDEQDYHYYFHLVGDGHCRDEDCKEDWRSTQVYEKPEDAIRDFQMFLNLLRAKPNYRAHLDETGYFDCWSRGIIPDEESLHRAGACQDCPDDKDEEMPKARCCYYIGLVEVLAESTRRFKIKENAWGKPSLLAVHPGRALTLQEASDAIQGFCNCFYYENQYPLETRVEERVGLCGETLCYFRLEGGPDRNVLFESYNGYNSKEEAERAAGLLISNIYACRNFVVIKNGDCDYRIAVSGINLQDCPVEEDWARVVSCSNRKFKNLAAACEARSRIASYFENASFSLKLEFSHLWVSEANPLESQRCLKTNIQLLRVNTETNEQILLEELAFVSTGLYEQEAEAEAVRKVELLARQASNYRIVADQDCYYCLGLTEEEGPGAVTIAVVQPEGSNIPYPEIDGRGLEYFIDASCEEGAFYPYVRGDEERCFTFRIVSKAYRLAKHPFDYHTPKGAREAIKWLKDKCSCEGLPDVNIEVESEGEVHNITVRPRPGAEPVQVKVYNKKCGEDAECAFMELLGSAQHYSITLSGDDSQEKKKLCPRWPTDANEEESATAYKYLQDAFQESGYGEDVLRRFICRFPLYKDGDQYGFQLYCEEFLQSGLPFIASDFDDSEPCAGCNGNEPGSGSGESGAFAWVSAQTYSSFEEARCHYHTFCSLLGELPHYQPTDLLECGPYSIELVNPDEVLAEHPQCYNFLSELKEAMGRTMACIHEEGLHLVEHILLRPHKYAEVTHNNEVVYPYDCLLPADPDCACDLFYDFKEDDPCSGEEEEPEKDCPPEPSDDDESFYIPGSDPYSFWATIVLPCWPKRFRDHNFREFFQELIRREAPSHIGVNIQWVGPWQLCRFEEQYRRWLRLTSGRETCDSSDVFCSFVDCIKSLSCCPPEYKDEESVPTCETDEEKAAGSRLMLNISNLYIRNLFSASTHAASSAISQSPAYLITGNLAATNLAIAPAKDRFGKTRSGKEGRLKLPQCDEPQVFLARARGVVADAKTEAEPKEKAKAKPKSAEKAKPKPKKAAKKSEKKKPAAKPKPKAKAAPPPEPLSRREVAQRIRQRQAQYSKALEDIDDRYFKQTNAYKRAEFFIGQTDGNLQAFADLVRFVLDDQNERNKPEYAPYYTEILKNATWYCLDKLVLSDTGKVQEPDILKPLLAAMKKQGVSLAALRKEWQGEALKEWTGAGVVDEYKKMLK